MTQKPVVVGGICLLNNCAVTVLSVPMPRRNREQPSHIRIFQNAGRFSVTCADSNGFSSLQVCSRGTWAIVSFGNDRQLKDASHKLPPRMCGIVLQWAMHGIAVVDLFTIELFLYHEVPGNCLGSPTLPGAGGLFPGTLPGMQLPFHRHHTEVSHQRGDGSTAL